MSIIVRDINGKSININVRRIDSIQLLKEKIYSRTGISINDQVLSFAGKYLENYRKLYEYNILRNSILSLNLGLKGGAASIYVFTASTPNSAAKSATVGIAFLYAAENVAAHTVTTGTVTASPTLPASLSASVVSQQLQLSGTPVSGDVGSYTVTFTCTSGNGPGTGVSTFNFTLTISSGAACIVSGQRILTPNGYKLIDDIYNGDLVTTSQNKDVVALNYKGVFQFTTNETAPYIIPKDSINPSYPPKDIFLSAEHRIQTNYNWVTPKELSKYNPEVRQLNVGKPVVYYNIETPNYATDHLILEGTTVASYRFPGSENLVNIHGNL
jgi:hypothetical protein